MLRCPWHGWEFDVRTGQSWFDPKQVRVKCYEVVVAPGSAVAAAQSDGGLQRGPYVAESYPVAIEKNYVLVEMQTPLI